MRYMTVSELLCYQTCKPLWAAKYYHHRKIRNEAPSALDLGSAFHQAMEEQANDRDLFKHRLGWKAYFDKCLTERAEATGHEPRDGDLRAADSLSIQAADFWGDPKRRDEEILANEKSMEFPLLEGVMLRFKPDIVFRNKHGVWHRQYKTIATSAAVPDYVRLIKHSMHEAAYRYGIIHALGLNESDYMGTDLVCFVKDPVHAKLKGGECTHCSGKDGKPRKGYVYRKPEYKQQPLRVSPEMVRAKLLQMQMVGENILNTEDELDRGVKWNSARLDPAEHACYTRQRRLCWAFDACREQTVELDNDQLYESFDPDARYNEEEPVEDPRSQ